MFSTSMTLPRYTMWKLTSWGFRKCGSFQNLVILNQSNWLSKSGQNWRTNSMGRRRQKKRHGHNIDFLGLKLNQHGSHMDGSTLIQFQGPTLIIVAVSFFFNASYFRGQTSFLRLLHLWRLITPCLNLPSPIKYRFSESSERQLSHGPNLDIFFYEQISRKEHFMQNIRF